MAVGVGEDWPAIAAQQLYVRARFVDDRTRAVAGARFLHPYVRLDTFNDLMALDDLVHPEVWFADQTDTWEEGLRRNGIASALYAHLRLFEYDITQSQVLMADDVGVGNGVGLWRRLHPNYDDDLDAGRLRTLTADFTDAKRSEIVARFEADPGGDDFDLLAVDHSQFGFYPWP